MRFYESRQLQCKKKVFIVNNGTRTETKDIKVNLSWIADGEEGGEFDSLFIDIENVNEVAQSLNEGDSIEIEATKKHGDTRYDMFEPIEINVVTSEDGKKRLELETDVASGSWCFNVNQEWTTN